LFVHLSLLEFFAEMWDYNDVPSERLDELVSDSAYLAGGIRSPAESPRGSHDER